MFVINFTTVTGIRMSSSRTLWFVRVIDRNFEIDNDIFRSFVGPDSKEAAMLLFMGAKTMWIYEFE